MKSQKKRIFLTPCKKEKKYDEQFRIVFEAIRRIMAPPPTPKKKIGFHIEEEKAPYRSLK